MSYTKHTWTNGEIVTAAKMNNIETGIEEASSGGGVLVVHVTMSDGVSTLDKTWQEIKDADAVSIVRDNPKKNVRSFLFCSYASELVPIGGGDTEYRVSVNSLGDSEIINFIASSASSYPSATIE